MTEVSEIVNTSGFTASSNGSHSGFHHHSILPVPCPLRVVTFALFHSPRAALRSHIGTRLQWADIACLPGCYSRLKDTLIACYISALPGTIATAPPQYVYQSPKPATVSNTHLHIDEIARQLRNQTHISPVNNPGQWCTSRFLLLFELRLWYTQLIGFNIFPVSASLYQYRIPSPVDNLPCAPEIRPYR